MTLPKSAPSRPTRSTLKPIVAIVGRPNVGKSTLFNRLLGERTAIVTDVPGTTRDRVYGDVEWDDAAFTIVDTGGMDLQATGEIEVEVQRQARMAVEEADAIVFVVDAQAGITPVDLDVAQVLRQRNQPLILVANKVEGRVTEATTAEFNTLGLGEPVAISAYHGSGIRDLLAQLVQMLPPMPEPIAPEPGIQVAILGRPNVGKSMLVNAILGQERVLVSSVPGTTRDAVDTPFVYQAAPLTLIDTAGIRRRGRVEQGIEKFSVMRALRAIDRAHVVILVIDTADGLTSQDTHIAGYIKESYKGLVIAVNKWDLAKEAEADRLSFTRLLAARLPFFPHAPVVFTSGLNRQGIPQMLDAVLQVQASRQTRVATGPLNQTIRQAVSSHNPPTIHNRQLKVYYVTQAETAPPTFVFFVNDPELVHFSYQRFLENRLRQAFGFEGAALRMIFKSREENGEWNSPR